MEKFKYFEHTADIEFEAYGFSLEEAFCNAALAFYNSIVNLSEIEEREKIEVETEGFDLVNLLYNFLEELLFYFDTKGFLGKRVELKIEKNKKLKLKAKVFGEFFDESKHNYKTEIKAVTYHQMKVENKNGRWICHVILDI